MTFSKMIGVLFYDFGQEREEEQIGKWVRKEEK
jgi:hypothetical protein